MCFEWLVKRVIKIFFIFFNGFNVLWSGISEPQQVVS